MTKLLLNSFSLFYDHGYQIKIHIVNWKNYFPKRESNLIMNHMIHY